MGDAGADEDGSDHEGTRSSEDDTVQTLLKNASERCRRLSQRCASVQSKGLRLPTPGPIERVDPKQLEKIEPAPRTTRGPVTRWISVLLGERR